MGTNQRKARLERNRQNRMRHGRTRYLHHCAEHFDIFNPAEKSPSTASLPHEEQFHAINAFGLFSYQAVAGRTL